MNSTQNALDQFMDKMVGDIGAAYSAALVLIGDKLGLYSFLAENGALDAAALAAGTGTAERYVREWLAGQAAAGYVEYDAGTERFSMTPEQIMVFANEDSPVFMQGLFETAASMFRDEPKVTEAFRTGEGVGWHEHCSCLFSGTERFFRAPYNAHLVQDWIPALDGVKEKLEQGAKVADVGCGHGVSTLLMANAFPNSTFTGFDYHDESIRRAREIADCEGLNGSLRFEVSSAKEFPGDDYDLITFFDCLHDMGDPIGAAKRVRQSLAPSGTWMIVEPFAHDSLEENLNPVGRLYYAASTMICTPASLSQDVGLGLGAQAGEARLRDVVQAGGFSRFRRATETPFNFVLEARA